MSEHDTPDILDPMAVALRASGPRISCRIFTRRTSTWLLAGGAMTVLAACGSAAATKEEVAVLRKEVTALKGEGAKATDAHGAPGATTAKHWEYAGANWPEKWGELAPENAVCSAGSTQSPIDIAGTQLGAMGPRTSSGSPRR